MTQISVIVAMDKNRLIGRGDALPWYLPADLAHFRKTTMGKPIVMGRRTHESIGRPLPGRRNIVISRNPAFAAKGCETATSFDEATRRCADDPEIMVIGGSAIYQLALPVARRVLLTQVHARFDGDTWFPDALTGNEWIEVDREDHEADDNNAVPYSFIELRRKDAG